MKIKKYLGALFILSTAFLGVRAANECVVEVDKDVTIKNCCPAKEIICALDCSRIKVIGDVPCEVCECDTFEYCLSILNCDDNIPVKSFPIKLTWQDANGDCTKELLAAGQEAAETAAYNNGTTAEEELKSIFGADLPRFENCTYFGFINCVMLQGLAPTLKCFDENGVLVREDNLFNNPEEFDDGASDQQLLDAQGYPVFDVDGEPVLAAKGSQQNPSTWYVPELLPGWKYELCICFKAPRLPDQYTGEDTQGNEVVLDFLLGSDCEGRKPEIGARILLEGQMTETTYCVPVNVIPNSLLSLDWAFGITGSTGEFIPNYNGEQDGPLTCDGSTQELKLTLTNNGPSDATGVKVQIEFPLGIELVSVDVPNFPAETFDEASGVWTIGDLANGDSTCIVLTIQNNASACMDSVNLHASVVTDSLACENEPVWCPVLLRQCYDLIAKLAGVPDGPLCCDDEFCFSVLVTNFGPCTANEVEIDLTQISCIELVSVTNLLTDQELDLSGVYSNLVIEAGETLKLQVVAKPELDQNGVFCCQPDQYSDFQGIAGYVIVRDLSDPLNEVNPQGYQQSEWHFDFGPIEVNRCADIIISLCANSDRGRTPCRGEKVFYTVTLETVGCKLKDTDTFCVEILLPGSLEYCGLIGLPSSGGVIEPEPFGTNGNALLWDCIDLSDGGPATLSFQATVTQLGRITVCGTIAGFGGVCGPYAVDENGIIDVNSYDYTPCQNFIPTHFNCQLGCNRSCR